MYSGRLGRRLILLLLVTFIAFTLQIQQESQHKVYKKELSSDIEHQRIKRAYSKKPGFFRTLFSVAFEQWNDTKNTFGTINNLINDNFLPDNPPITPPTTVNPDPNATTTAAPFKITRSEFNRILRRNLRGLVRLYNIELQDALKQSDQNYADHKRNASLEVSKFL